MCLLLSLIVSMCVLRADGRNLTVGILVALLTLLGAGLVVCIKRKTLAGLLFSSKKNPIEKLRSEPFLVFSSLAFLF